MDIDKKSVAERITKVRKATGMTREKFGASLPHPTSRQVVTQWENGIAVPSLDRLLDISEMCNVSLDYLLKEPKEINYIEAIEIYMDIYGNIVTNALESLEGLTNVYQALDKKYKKASETNTIISKEADKIVKSSKIILDLCNKTVFDLREQELTDIDI